MLNVKMPNPISFVTVFKVSPYQILILGGLIESDSETKATYPTNQVLRLDIRYPDITKLPDLSRDFVSIYPAFYDNKGSLLLVNEDGRGEYPELLSYDISSYLSHKGH
jgi:hypothetical protein